MTAMSSYVTRRLLLVLPTLFVVMVFVFLVIRLFPGDIVDYLSSEQGFTPEQLALERNRLGIDKPIHEQFVVWVGSILRGDFGQSLKTRRLVVNDIQQKIPVTLELGALAILFSVMIAVPVGVISSIRQDTVADYLGRGIAIWALSIPGFWLATMLILALTLWFHWLPPVQYVPFHVDPWKNLQQFFLPSLVLGINLSGILMRMTRTTLLDVLRQDYIRTAWAKGLRERSVLFGHAIRNALLPVVTILGVEAARVVGGSVVMETIFGLPGVGRYVLEVLSVRDYPAIQAAILLIATFVIVINLVVDLLYGYLDPRIRLR